MQQCKKGVGGANGEEFSQLYSQSTRWLEGDRMTRPPPSVLSPHSLCPSIHPPPLPLSFPIPFDIVIATTIQRL